MTPKYLHGNCVTPITQPLKIIISIIIIAFGGTPECVLASSAYQSDLTTVPPSSNAAKVATNYDQNHKDLEKLISSCNVSAESFFYSHHENPDYWPTEDQLKKSYDKLFPVKTRKRMHLSKNRFEAVNIVIQNEKIRSHTSLQGAEKSTRKGGFAKSQDSSDWMEKYHKQSPNVNEMSEKASLLSLLRNGKNIRDFDRFQNTKTKTVNRKMEHSIPDWTDVLLRNISSIPVIGLPGCVVVFGNNAEPILTSPVSPHEVLIGAAEFGQGRIVVISHNGYASGLDKSHSDVVQPDVRALQLNIIKWLTAGKDDRQELPNRHQIVSLIDPKLRAEDLELNQVLYWSGGDDVVLTQDDVLNFVHRGGSLIHAMTPWGWLQLSGGKPMLEMPYYEVLLKAGIAYSDGCMRTMPRQKLDVSKNIANVAHVFRQIHSSLNNTNELLKNLEVVNMIRFIPLSFVDDEWPKMMQSLFHSLKERVRGILPTTNMEQVHTMELWLSIHNWLGLSNVVAPGCERFPGNFETPPPQVTKQFKIESNLEEVYSTGLYLPAGQTMKIEIITVESKFRKYWKILVGAHTDILTNEVVTRWPTVYKTDYIHASKIPQVVGSPFGGMVYLLSPQNDGNERSFIDVKISGATEAPVFRITDRDEAVTKWKSQRNAPGLWADIIGRYVTVTLPSTSIRKLDDPTKIVTFWDQVVTSFHELRGTDVTKHRRQWIVTDIKPSAGYMHAGYPIVTHLDVADPSDEYFILNYETNKRLGNWGLFHEIGHNMARDEYIFENTGEAVANIYTLFAMDKFCKKKVWIHEWLKMGFDSVVKYLTDTTGCHIWKNYGDVQLFLYAQMARDFGWKTYSIVLKRYEKMDSSEKPTTNQDKIDSWFEIFSETTGHSLAALAQFWGIPVTPVCRQKLVGFPNYLPDDDITRAVPSRTNKILQEYPDTVRPHSADEYKLYSVQLTAV